MTKDAFLRNKMHNTLLLLKKNYTFLHIYIMCSIIVSNIEGKKYICIKFTNCQWQNNTIVGKKNKKHYPVLSYPVRYFANIIRKELGASLYNVHNTKITTRIFHRIQKEEQNWLNQ